MDDNSWYFEKQLLKKGETKTYKFEVDLQRDLSFVDGDGKRFLENGEYNIIVKNHYKDFKK